MSAEELSLKQFAERLGVRPSYITKLKADGRLVLTENGKRVSVDASIARIAATRDPGKHHTAQRHAGQRAAPVPPPADPNVERAGNSYQAARAVREKYAALQAKADYESAMGKLLDAGRVEAALMQIATTLRTRLESLPDTLAPQVTASTDEQYSRALIADAVEHALTSLVEDFNRITTP